MKTILSSPKFITPTTLIAIFYIISVVYLMNARLVGDTIISDFPLTYKITLLINLLGGMWTAMSVFGLFVLLLTAILTGINLTLVFQKLSILKTAGNLKLMVGGSSLLGVIGSGCAACGLPVLALFGLSGSLAYLPLRGTELSIIAVALLFISLFFMIKTNSKMVCDINLRVSKA